LSINRFAASKKRVTPTTQSVFQLHVFLHVEENERAEIFPLASSRGVAAKYARIVHPLVPFLANLLAFLSKPGPASWRNRSS
jgi:hypothetical protein